MANSSVRSGNNKTSEWDWVGTTEEYEISYKHATKVSRLDYPSCHKGFCRINCRRNPNCLNKIGETFWINEIKDNHWTSCVDDPEELYLRKEGSHVGLQNLGATCYINTFLQLWFHSKLFRSVIFTWQPPGGYMVKDTTNPIVEMEEVGSIANDIAAGPPNIVFPEITSNSSSAIILSKLQLIFALMKDSKRRFIDPRQLIEALNLQEHEQQDAQEFSNLFMNVLQGALQVQYPVLWTAIEKQFSGQYSYVTRCIKCGNSSTRPSRFSEIVLSLGHSVLHECIKDFLKEEKMEGDNKYNCLTCGEKTDATRSIQLDSLPPVLSLQLLRFVFDRETWSKRKVNTSLQFPKTLNMNDFMQFESKEDGIYTLSAVLLHKGLSANSGHYVARIKDQETDVWFSFDDKEVKQQKSNSTRVTIDDDVMDVCVPDGQSKPKQRKYVDSSKNAYMLVYKRQKKEQDDDFRFLPEDVSPSIAVQRFVEQDNKCFSDWMENIQSRRKKIIEDGKERQNHITRVLEVLPANDVQDAVLISLDWLKKWLNNTSNEIPEISNEDFLCSHDKVPFTTVSKFKLISKEAAHILYERFGGSRRLTIANLCLDCVKQQYHQIKFDKKLSEDYLYIQKELKRKDLSLTDGYWVGKMSLRLWKGLATSTRQKKLQPVDKVSEDDLNDDTNSSSETSDKPGDEMQHCCQSKFNKELLCQGHGNLSLKHEVRRLVPKNVWMRLKSYFPDAPEFPANTYDCERCQESLVLKEKEQNDRIAAASRMKKNLWDLYNDNNRPFLPNGSTVEGSENRVFVISREFYLEWKKFLR